MIWIFKKTDDPVLNATNKYRYHSSIVMINSKSEPEVYSYNMMTFLEKLKISMFGRHHNKATFQLKY